MKKLYCEYCGSLISEGCSCANDAEQARLDFIEEYENRPDVTYGWSQQDLIDRVRMER